MRPFDFPRNRALALLLAASMLLPVAQAGHWSTRNSFEPDDGPVILDKFLDIPQIRDKLAEKTSASDLHIEMTTRTTTWLGDKERHDIYRLQNVDAGFGRLNDTDIAASYHVQAHEPTYKDILNIDEADRFNYISCALADNRMTLTADSRSEQAQINLLIDNLNTDDSRCRLSAGDEVGFRGLSGTAEVRRRSGAGLVLFQATLETPETPSPIDIGPDPDNEVGLMVFNQYGAPVGWAHTVADHLKDPEDDKDTDPDDGETDPPKDTNDNEIETTADDSTDDESPPVDAAAVRGIVADYHQNWWGCLKVSPGLEQNLSRARSRMEEGEYVSYAYLDSRRIEECFKSRSWNTVPDEDTGTIGFQLAAVVSGCNDEIIEEMANSVMPPYPANFIVDLKEAGALGMMDEDTLVINLGGDCITSTVRDHL